MKRVLLALIARMAAAGVRPSDSDDVRLYKATMSLTTGLISLAGVVWAGMYAALGLYRAAVIPLAYAALSAITLPLAIATDRFDLFRTGQLGMMAILPFLLQWQLGGIARSGAVVVWSFWTPLYALLTGASRGWQGWLVVFLVLVAASGIFEHAAAAGAPSIPPVLSAIFFALNIGRLAEQHHLEKIKTIGDSYMVVGGLPAPRPDHAEAVAEMALQMQEALDAYAVKGGMRLALRIGIHSGPVVAGVIGRKKFSYDL